MHLALSLLCENPGRQTGLTTVFREMVNRSLAMYPAVSWTVFSGEGLVLSADRDRVRHVHQYPGNDNQKARVLADQFQVSRHARRLGARALVTVGFVPLLSVLPTAMHLLTLHHLSRGNEISRATQLYRRFVAANGVRRCRLLITNSEFAARQIRGSQALDESKLLISNEGLDHAVFHPQAAPGEAEELTRYLGVPPGYILWVSNLYPYKQAAELVRAYATLAPEIRARHPLLFVGGDWQGQRAQTQRLAEELGVAGDVRLLGWVDEKWIVPLYRHAALHVLASREETWGRSVTEAMACGCPNLVNDIPVMHEVTRGQALLTDFRDTAAAGAALAAALGDGALRARLRKGGLARAAELSFDRLTRERMDRILQIAA